VIVEGFHEELAEMRRRASPTTTPTGECP